MSLDRFEAAVRAPSSIQLLAPKASTMGSKEQT
jgi:hypothetical protein